MKLCIMPCYLLLVTCYLLLVTCYIILLSCCLMILLSEAYTLKFKIWKVFRRYKFCYYGVAETRKKRVIRAVFRILTTKNFSFNAYNIDFPKVFL